MSLFSGVHILSTRALISVLFCAPLKPERTNEAPISMKKAKEMQIMAVKKKGLFRVSILNAPFMIL